MRGKKETVIGEATSEEQSQKRNRLLAYTIHCHLPTSLKAQLPESELDLKKLKREQRNPTASTPDFPRPVFLEFLPPTDESLSSQQDSLHKGHWLLSRILKWRHVQLVVVEGNTWGNRWGRYQGWRWDFSQGGWSPESLIQASKSVSVHTDWKYNERSGLLCLGWTLQTIGDITNLVRDLIRVQKDYNYIRNNCYIVAWLLAEQIVLPQYQVRQPQAIRNFEPTMFNMTSRFLFGKGLDGAEVKLVRYDDIPEDFQPLHGKVLETPAQIAQRQRSYLEKRLVDQGIQRAIKSQSLPPQDLESDDFEADLQASVDRSAGFSPGQRTGLHADQFLLAARPAYQQPRERHSRVASGAGDGHEPAGDVERAGGAQSGQSSPDQHTGVVSDSHRAQRHPLGRDTSAGRNRETRSHLGKSQKATPPSLLYENAEDHSRQQSLPSRRRDKAGTHSSLLSADSSEGPQSIPSGRHDRVGDTNSRVTHGSVSSARSSRGKEGGPRSQNVSHRRHDPRSG